MDTWTGRSVKKLRSRQRERVTDVLTAIVRSENEQKNGTTPTIDQEDWERIEKEGLIHDANLNLFLTWYLFGGTERGISLSELMTLPADVIADFTYIFRRLGEIRSIYGDKPEGVKAKRVDKSVKND